MGVCMYLIIGLIFSITMLAVILYYDRNRFFELIPDLTTAILVYSVVTLIWPIFAAFVFYGLLTGKRY